MLICSHPSINTPPSVALINLISGCFLILFSIQFLKLNKYNVVFKTLPSCPFILRVLISEQEVLLL